MRKNKFPQNFESQFFFFLTSLLQNIFDAKPRSVYALRKKRYKNAFPIGKITYPFIRGVRFLECPLIEVGLFFFL